METNNEGPAHPPHSRARLPSQVRYPWRSALRSAITGLIALIPLLPQIADAANIDEIPAVASFLAVSVAVSRVLALPGVDKWLDTFVPWLSAEGYTGKHRDHD